MALQRIRLTPGFGFEICGVELSHPIDDETKKYIIDAWIEGGVLLFRGAGTSDENQMRLSELFGQMEPSAKWELNREKNPYLMTLLYDPSNIKPPYKTNYILNGEVRAGYLGWHWDQSFMPKIVRGSVLRMIEPSRVMGETGFIDAIEAYDRLPGPLKERIEGLEVVYQLNHDFRGQFGFPKDIAVEERPEGNGLPLSSDDNFPPVVHPMVIVQPETGRKVLKLSPMHARYVLGMDREESDLLLEEVAEHIVDERYAYFHKWSPNDILVWDNWRVIHCATGHPADNRRYGVRTTIMGDYKVGRYLDPTLDRNRKVRRLAD